MQQLWSTIINSLTSALSRFVLAFKRFTNPRVVLQLLIVKFRTFFGTLLNVKPKDKKDYYTALGWMISRKLAHLLIFIVGIGCLIYILSAQPIKEEADTGLTNNYTTYRYSSIPLRFLNKNVNIKAKDGYIAYSGAVSKGYASGQGTLYREDGSKVYEGEFAKSKFSGTGTLYYPSEQVEYTGQFDDNLFDGEGTQYRENGSRLYEGNFSKGMKEGTGVLYNTTDDQVFSGSFHLDELIYTQILNKTADEIGDLYTGNQTIYSTTDGTSSAVVMSDIDVVYLSKDKSTSIDETLKSDMLVVGKATFTYGSNKLTTVEELTKALGEPIYEGNSYINMTEAVAIDYLKDKGHDIDVDTGLVIDAQLDELVTVSSYDSDTSIYLHSYEIGEQTYTFLSTGKTGSFFMYEIE